MGSDDEAKKAIADLNGKELEGRAIAVNEARPREDRRPSFNDRGSNDRRDGQSDNRF